MFAPKRRQPLAQVLSRYPCATVAIDGPSPAAGGSRSSLLEGGQRGNDILHAACNLHHCIDKTDYFPTSSVRCPNFCRTPAERLGYLKRLRPITCRIRPAFRRP